MELFVIGIGVLAAVMSIVLAAIGLFSIITIIYLLWKWRG